MFKLFTVLSLFVSVFSYAQVDYETAPYIGGVITDNKGQRDLRLVCIRNSGPNECSVFQFVRIHRARGQERRFLINTTFFKVSTQDTLNRGLRAHAQEDLTADSPTFFQRSQVGLLTPPLLMITIPVDIILSPVDAAIMTYYRLKANNAKKTITGLFTGKQMSVSNERLDQIQFYISNLKSQEPKLPKCGLNGSIEDRIDDCARIDEDTYLPDSFSLVSRKDVEVSLQLSRGEIVFDKKTNLLWGANKGSIPEIDLANECESGDHIIPLPGIKWRLPTQTEFRTVRGNGLLLAQNNLYWSSTKIPGTNKPSKYDSESDQISGNRDPGFWGVIKCVAEVP